MAQVDKTASQPDIRLIDADPGLASTMSDGHLIGQTRLDLALWSDKRKLARQKRITKK